MTTADRLRSEGYALGHAEGRIEGRIEGKAELLLHLFHKRFGPLPLTISARIRAAALQEIDAWAKRVFDANTLDDLFPPPA